MIYYSRKYFNNYKYEGSRYSYIYAYVDTGNIDISFYFWSYGKLVGLVGN